MAESLAADGSKSALDVASKSGRPESDALQPLAKEGGLKDVALEEDVPLDGRDLEGEAMIRSLPKRNNLSEPVSQANARSDGRPREPI